MLERGRAAFAEAARGSVEVGAGRHRVDLQSALQDTLGFFALHRVIPTVSACLHPAEVLVVQEFGVGGEAAAIAGIEGDTPEKVGIARLEWRISPHGPRKIGGARVGVERQRTLDQRPEALAGQSHILIVQVSRLQPGIVERCIGRREIRVQRDSLLKIRHRGLRFGHRKPTEQGAAAQVSEVGLDITAAHLCGRGGRECAELC